MDSASRSNYYNSPAMVTTTTATFAKPLPQVPTLPDNGGSFANGFIPPYEDHKSDNDDSLKFVVSFCSNKLNRGYQDVPQGLDICIGNFEKFYHI